MLHKSWACESEDTEAWIDILLFWILFTTLNIIHLVSGFLVSIKHFFHHAAFYFAGWIDVNYLAFYPKKVIGEESEVAQSCPILCNPMNCSPTRLLHPWDFPGRNTGVGCHFLLQEIFPIQGLNLGLLHCRQMLYCLSQREVAHHNWISPWSHQLYNILIKLTLYDALH